MKGIWLQLIGGDLVKSKLTIDPTVHQVLEDFEAVFAEPHGLPPPLSHDHKIQLREGSKPACV